MLRVSSTRDVPLQVLRDLSEELGPDFGLEVDEGQVVLLSTEPPSWITFIANSQWWVQALAAYAALYVAEIVKEAGKETWKDRGKAFAALVRSADKLKNFAAAVARTLGRLRANTRAIVAIPVPDDIYATQLYLSSRDENEIVLEIALLIHHLPALMELINREGLNTGRASGWIGLYLLDDGSLQITWFEMQSLEKVQRVIPLQRAP